MDQTFLLEPELIAAADNPLPDENNDLIIAKNFLKTQAGATGDTVYDHLVNLVSKVVLHKLPDSIDNIEQLSWEVKTDHFKATFDNLNDVYLPPDNMKAFARLNEMYEFLRSKAPKIAELGEEEEEELDLEEVSHDGKVEDFIENNFYFRQAGFGFPDREAYNIFTALKVLAAKEPVSSVRFFGKIYGTKRNYYVAEANLTMEELDRRVRLFDLAMMPGEGQEAEEKEIPVTELQEGLEMLGEGEQVDTGPKERQPPTPPPLPVSHWTPPPVIPVERPGQGVNRKVYFVCNHLGDDWECLPDVTPQQITAARQFVRCMTGHLDQEILTYPPFEGTERNFLRAQIARIAAATSVSPRGFYTFGSGEEEEDVEPEEGMGDMDLNQNQFYQGHSIKDLLDKTLNYWVHHGKYIFKQGRTIWWNPNAGAEEAVEEEEQPGGEALPETGPPLLTALGQDDLHEGAPAWVLRATSTLTPDRALAALRSRLWPGAVAYADSGKRSGCMYVGWGLKSLPPNYSPPLLPRVQEEYPLGPEIMEMTDPSFADEEAFRIAHLPPEPVPEIVEEEEPPEDEEEDEE